MGLNGRLHRSIKNIVIYIGTTGLADDKNTIFFGSYSRKCTVCRWYDLNLIPQPAPLFNHTLSPRLLVQSVKIVQRKPFLLCCIPISHFYI